MVPLLRVAVAAALVVAASPAAAVSRPAASGPSAGYALVADAWLRPSSTELRLTVLPGDGIGRLEKVQVKVRPVGGGDAETQNLFDVRAEDGVATLALPRLSLLQQVEVTAHVKDGAQNVVRDETVVQYAQRGAVSSDHALATEAGEKILASGGNAFDAAAAMLFVLNVVQPALAGIGGGSEVVVHVAAEHETYAIVGRERAPAATTTTMYDDQLPASPTQTQIMQAQNRIGLNGYSVGVPGTLRAVTTMLDRWGTRSLAEVLEPAIGYAENGFKVGSFLARDANARGALLQPEAASLFRPGGVPLQVGQTFAQPDLAETFRLLAREGDSVFYTGEIAQAIVAAQKRLAVGSNAIAGGAGRMTLADLAAFDVDVRRPSHLNYKGYDVFAAPAPSSGGPVLLETLGLLEQRFAIGAAAGYEFGTRKTIHAMVESWRLAFADRDMWIGDPSALPVPEAQLLSDAYLRDRAVLLSEFPVRMAPNTAVAPGNPWTYAEPAAALGADGSEDADDSAGHTTHFSVVDAFGNAVSFTSTLRDSFGSGILVQPYGFVLNNSLSLFNLPSRKGQDPGANNAGPGRRPMGSQTPTLVLRNGELVAATGTYGAEFIPVLVLNVVLDLIDHGISLQDAVDSSRIWGRFSNGVYTWSGFAFRNGSSIPLAEILALRDLGVPRPEANPPAANRVFGSLASVGVDPATLDLVGAADDARQTDASAVVVGR